jgi:hypothetical protein
MYFSVNLEFCEQRSVNLTRYSDGLWAGRWDDRGSIPGGGWEFVQPALEPIQPRIQLVPEALSPGVKRPGGNHSPPSSAEVKECVELYLHSPIHLHGVVLSWKIAHRQLYLLWLRGYNILTFIFNSWPGTFSSDGVFREVVFGDWVIDSSRRSTTCYVVLNFLKCFYQRVEDSSLSVLLYRNVLKISPYICTVLRLFYSFMDPR